MAEESQAVDGKPDGLRWLVTP